MHDDWISLVVGFLAALLSWLPGVGFLLAGAALWLAVRAVRKQRGPIGMAGLSLALVAAAVTSVVHIWLLWRITT